MLIGHLLGSAVLFLVLFFFGWLISWALHWMHGIHPFPEKIFAVIGEMELWLLYFDAILCGFVVLAGAYRFVKDLAKG